MFLFQLISLLLISITFYTYLANIVFSCDLDFNGLPFVMIVVCLSVHSSFVTDVLWLNGLI